MTTTTITSSSTTSRAARLVPAVTGLVAMAIVAFMISSVTTAVWIDTTTNTDNAWATGQISLDGAESLGALFQAENMVPGTTISNDITIDNTSSVPLDVRLYGADAIGSTDLAANLNLTVEAEGATIYSGTLADFGTEHSAWATAVGTSSIGPDEARTYGFTVTLDEDAPQSLAGTSAGISFVWEGQTNG